MRTRIGALALLVITIVLCVPCVAQASAREVEVIIQNRTDKRLIGDAVSTSHGVIRTRPPRYIAPGQSGRLLAVSNGFATGTEGRVSYRIEGVPGMVRMHFDNPFAGSNSYDSQAPAGYATDHTIGHANHTVVFFFVRAVTQAATTCNGQWVVDHLGRTPEDRLSAIDRDVGVFSTPLKGIGLAGGWVDTGCFATAVGAPIRDAQHSTDGFWTIDLLLTSFTAGGASLPPRRTNTFVRIEVEPGTPAHNSAHALATVPIRVAGHVFIDTHHGEQLIEIHPYNPMTLASGPSGPDACAIGYVWREAFAGDHVCVPPASRQRAANDNAAAAGRRAPVDLTYGPDTCATGFVWREAFVNDHVCVASGVRQQAADDNAAAPNRRAEGGGPYGPDTCLQGYVWREASAADHVCVPPATRQQAADDNAAAPRRFARALASGVCMSGYVWREASPNDHVCVVPSTRADTALENQLGMSRRAK
jgi:hypothetical protein